MAKAKPKTKYTYKLRSGSWLDRASLLAAREKAEATGEEINPDDFRYNAGDTIRTDINLSEKFDMISVNPNDKNSKRVLRPANQRMFIPMNADAQAATEEATQKLQEQEKELADARAALQESERQREELRLRISELEGETANAT